MCSNRFELDRQAAPGLSLSRVDAGGEYGHSGCPQIVRFDTWRPTATHNA